MRLRVGKYAITAIATILLFGACSTWRSLPVSQSELPASAQTESSIAPQDAPVAMPAPAIVEVAVATAVVSPRAEVLPPATPKPEADSPSLPSVATQNTSPLPLAKGYYINVGLFAVPSNGSNAYRKLEVAGLPVFSDGLQTRKGLLTRVRVGPFPTRAQANAAVKKIQSLKLDAAVFQL